MNAFITPFVTSGRLQTSLATVCGTTPMRPSQPLPRKAFVQMTAAKDEMHDDDDATLGTSDGPVYGMTAPDLTDADKAYLDAAANNDEYFKRMIEIARRIDVERRMSPDFKRVSTDDYFATLSKKKE